MEQVHGTYKASKFEPQYFISSVPENVMANIMNRLPIQDAVRTGPITKFTLDFTENVMDAEDINHWVLFLSRKGIKELTLNNIFSRVLHKLPTHLYSCMELKHLKFSRCSFHLSRGFHGFPNFIARCSLLEILDFHNLDNMSEEILIEISKLENLKSLSWNLVRTITNSCIFLLMLTGLSKLQ
ncbi:F-box/FBD/LRR-repeat protein-like protein, partial [Tanacetum coccineum]